VPKRSDLVLLLLHVLAVLTDGQREVSLRRCLYTVIGRALTNCSTAGAAHIELPEDIAHQQVRQKAALLFLCYFFKMRRRLALHIP
jgi:hypothetical protein